MDALCRTLPPRHVVVVATTNQIEAVSASLRRAGRFECEVELPVPTAWERREVGGACIAMATSYNHITMATNHHATMLLHIIQLGQE